MNGGQVIRRGNRWTLAVLALLLVLPGVGMVTTTAGAAAQAKEREKQSTTVERSKQNRPNPAGITWRMLGQSRNKSLRLMTTRDRTYSKQDMVLHQREVQRIFREDMHPRRSGRAAAAGAIGIAGFVEGCPNGYDRYKYLADDVTGYLDGALLTSLFNNEVYYHSDGKNSVEWCGISYSTYQRDGDVPTTFRQNTTWTVDGYRGDPALGTDGIVISFSPTRETRTDTTVCDGRTDCFYTPTLTEVRHAKPPRDRMGRKVASPLSRRTPPPL